jgi:hypothetical protein
MNTDSPRPIRSEDRFRKPCFEWRSARPERSRRAENHGRLTSLNEAWVPHPHADLQACAAVFPSLSGLLQTVFCAALSPEAWPSSHERAERVNRLGGRIPTPIPWSRVDDHVGAFGRCDQQLLATHGYVQERALYSNRWNERPGRSICRMRNRALQPLRN